MIWIDGIRYGVGVKAPVLEHHDSHTLGYIDYDHSEITLRAGMSRNRLESTLIHEILHPMLITEDRIFDEDKEAVVGRLADKIYATFGANNIFADGWFDRLIDHVEDDKQRSERVEVDYGVESDTATDESVR